MSDKKTQKQMVGVRLSPTQIEQLDALAESQNKKTGEYIRELILQHLILQPAPKK